MVIYKYRVNSVLMRGATNIESPVPLHKGDKIKGMRYDYEITDIIHKDFLDRIDNPEFDNEKGKVPSDETNTYPIIEVKRLN